MTDDLPKRLRQLAKEMTEGDPNAASMLIVAAKRIESGGGEADAMDAKRYRFIRSHEMAVLSLTPEQFDRGVDLAAGGSSADATHAFKPADEAVCAVCGCQSQSHAAYVPPISSRQEES